MNKFFNLPLQKKIVSIYMIANAIIFVVNIFLIVGINSMARDMEMVYQDNRQLNELTDSLTDVQDNMTEYLSSKTTDSLENYFRSAQSLQILSEDLGGQVTDMTFSRMKRNIRNMIANYLEKVSQTIESKRGRNVEKYRNYYEESTELYEYITTYISRLNNEQFVSNSDRYAELAGAFRTFESISTMVLTLVMIGNIISIITIVGMMIRPLKRLAASANEVAEGNFDTALPQTPYHDEIGIVIGAFNKMVVSIKEYIIRQRESMEKERLMQEKELTMEAHLKDAQLKYLQAQINPHFLFNTLNAGAQLAMMEGADRTYEYVQTVADFFRYNVKNHETEVTIGEEVTLVDNYIRILNVRFSGDIHYQKQVDERLLSIEMPNMVLQPIVENAVNHGIREMGDKGSITLKVFRQDNDACISVTDNGKGIDLADIDRILDGSWKKDENRQDHNGIGMVNVISRLRLFTGKEDAVSIRSGGIGKGCEVLIRIPLQND